MPFKVDILKNNEIRSHQCVYEKIQMSPLGNFFAKVSASVPTRGKKGQWKRKWSLLSVNRPKKIPSLSINAWTKRSLFFLGEVVLFCCFLLGCW